MYSRHDLVWLTPDGWQSALAQAKPAERPALERWQREDWPAIVRRRDADAPPSVVSVGVALPPERETGIKPRIALRIDASGISRHTPALPVARVAISAPPQWRPALHTLAGDAHELGLRVYGSLALQSVTGLPYLTASSDIDLLFAPGTPAQLDQGVEVLTAACAHLPLDGEVVFPNGDAVAWKEWRDAGGAGAKVLVKSQYAVRLADPAALLETLEAA
jgi:phosphoribosyl-dephospho-CoA transferase